MTLDDTSGARTASADKAREGRLGVIAALGTYSVWGLSSLFYHTLSALDPLEVLAHRSLWALVFMGAFALATGRGPRVAEALRGRSGLVLCLSAVMISTNWFLFIWGVTSGHALEASLGYYLFPLTAAGSAAVLLGERFSRAQGAAVALAAAAAALLAVGLGAGPWISLALAVTFTTYGLAKRSLTVGPISSVVAETLILAPLALVYLAGMHLGWWHGWVRDVGPSFGQDWLTSAKLAFSGILTGGPLILFAYAAQRLRYATLGFIQYINPTLQFVAAATVFGEVVTRWHAIAFPMIWAALAVYSFESWRLDRNARRAARAPDVARAAP